MILKEFVYKFDEGPLESKEKLLENWTVGNCRRAVQYYIFEKFGIFLEPQKVLCPTSYRETGYLIWDDSKEFSFENLNDGDIIFAETIRNKKGEKINKGRETFLTEDDYIVSLHTALFTKIAGKEIWHATAKEGKSCFWTKEKFLENYRPVSVRRIILG